MACPSDRTSGEEQVVFPQRRGPLSAIGSFEEDLHGRIDPHSVYAKAHTMLA